MSVPWTAGMSLRCAACGSREEPGLNWNGCASCGAPLEVEYEEGSPVPLPIAAELLTNLGLRPTPLLPMPGRHDMWLKLESLNPTGSHKDRFHAVTSAIARLAGAAGVVTTSTGNHGVSCAAHAARDRLPCVVLATQELPQALESQIMAYGALVAKLAPDERRQALLQLVASHWLPATSSDPSLSGAGNPYGADGYRAIADEVIAALGGMPAAIAVPAASGDTLVGVSRGFAAAALRRGEPAPVLLACQPEGAAAIAASLASGRQVALAEPFSLARSTSDPSCGRLALAVLQRSGYPVVVGEEQIVQATRELALAGHYVETSSALALAGLSRARDEGLIAPDTHGVALLTAGGRGWSELAPGLFPGRPAVSTVEGLFESIGALAKVPIFSPLSSEPVH